MKLIARLNQEIYKFDALTLAPKFLGMFLCRNIGGKTIKLKITETECYYSEKDTACHAHKGKTLRTKTLYEEGGVAYVYLCYGMHYMFNIVTGSKEFPEAVLIRGAEGFNGPGKLTKYLKIDKELNGENLATSKKIWLEKSGIVCKFKAEKRIGIDYATEEYRNKLWRFLIA